MHVPVSLERTGVSQASHCSTEGSGLGGLSGSFAKTPWHGTQVPERPIRDPSLVKSAQLIWRRKSKMMILSF